MYTQKIANTFVNHIILVIIHEPSPQI